LRYLSPAHAFGRCRNRTAAVRPSAPARHAPLGYCSSVQAHGLSLQLTRVLPASREGVFDSFANAALLAKWWGPEGFTIPRIEFTPRVGATYRIEMQPPEGDAFSLTGTFREVEVPSRLAFSFQWEPPDPDDQDTVAQVSFHVTDDSTEVHLSQGPFKTQSRRDLHRDGWSQSFDKLRDLVAT
jgi:uncharacterized protein YndB with AHSA1/START domain